jgi:hypothetical protein
MAIISFDRSITVNPDWGLKNLEKAFDNAKDLSAMCIEYRPYKKATQADIRKLAEIYGKEQ